jgi:hypothetical protein
MPQFQKRAGATLREVTQDLADKNARLAELRRKRESALLFDDGNALDTLDGSDHLWGVLRWTGEGAYCEYGREASQTSRRLDSVAS